MVNNDTAGLNKFLSEMKKMEGQLNKMASSLTTEASEKIENLIKQEVYISEKRIKINKKMATVWLAKDNSIKIVFDEAADAIKFAKGEK